MINLTWRSLVDPFHSYFRTRRLASFIAAYSDLPQLKVLDVGGNHRMWDLLKENFGLFPQKLVLLNNAVWESYGEYEYVLGDAHNLEYEDDSFDLVFSNSVIEHLGNREDKLQFAQECCRVGKEVYIQTPNLWFPIEPHILTVFIHWLPKSLYKKLSFFSFYYLLKVITHKNPEKSGTIESLDYRIDQTNLLSKRQLQELFPQTDIETEKILGLEKSLIVSSRKL